MLRPQQAWLASRGSQSNAWVIMHTMMPPTCRGSARVPHRAGSKASRTSELLTERVYLRGRLQGERSGPKQEGQRIIHGLRGGKRSESSQTRSCLTRQRRHGAVWHATGWPSGVRPGAAWVHVQGGRPCRRHLARPFPDCSHERDACIPCTMHRMLAWAHCAASPCAPVDAAAGGPSAAEGCW